MLLALIVALSPLPSLLNPLTPPPTDCPSQVRNSWDVDWGEEGYIRLEYGSDQCGLTNDPTYVKVDKA